MNYDKKYFIEKFTAIPDELWITGVFSTADGKHCAVGHCNCRHDGDGEGVALCKLLQPDPTKNCVAVAINDGNDPRYQQPTPKARILAALNDLP